MLLAFGLALHLECLRAGTPLALVFERLSNFELSFSKDALVRATSLGKASSDWLVTVESVHAHAFVRAIFLVEHARRIRTTLEGTPGQIVRGVGWGLTGKVATQVGTAFLDACAVVIVSALVAFAARGT